jgi:tetratricopeptide (TPR) repeat protein
MQQFASSTSQSPYQEPASVTLTGREEPVDEREQRYIASLENFEKSQLAQGFVPLTPGALAELAQTTTNTPEPALTQEEPSLSSALAQLGNFSQTPGAPTFDEPWWNSMPQEINEPPVATTPGEITNAFAALGARTAEPVAPPPVTPRPIEPAPVFEPGPTQETRAETPLTPVYRSEVLLDNDLETTMKRPAVKLQPLQPATQGDRLYTNGKSRSNEHRQTDHGDDSNLSSHDRLVRAYQYQLNGAYDDAMQEYRVVIRNAPELLDDVISNMRALLKLNPRFSLGYRVLGDAYMRKGEYLQAMESYNKALTMAKKAKA